MNDTHLKNNHSPYNPHKLRPVVIAVTAAIGISGLLVGCGGGSGGGGKKSNSIITSGGNGGKTTGYGGNGGSVNFYALAADTVIEILTGKNKSPDTSGIPDPNLGSDPDLVLEVTKDTTIPIDDPATVPADEYFQVAGDCSIYISDGDADDDTW